MTTYALQKPATDFHYEEHELQVDGSAMATYIARPAHIDAPWPAVLVLMEIFGVNDHIRSVCNFLASEGYLAVAYNYFHRSTPNLNLGYTDADMAVGREHKAQVTREGILKDTRAVMDLLNSRNDIAPQSRFGAVGFCFGGHLAYLLAAQPEIAATASFYGAGVASAPLANTQALTIDETENIQGEIKVFFGAKDPLISPEDMQAVKTRLAQSGVESETVIYPDASHGFCCDQRGDYNPEAARDAWQKTLAMFARRLKA